MATLFDLAQQYLNRALPETFRYGPRTPTTPPPVTVPPQDPNAPTERILPVQGGSDNFSVYNPDPNSISNKNYSPYAYRQAAANTYKGPDDPGIGIPSGILSDSEFLYGPQLKGIPGAIAAYAKASPIMQFAGKGLDALGNLFPVNRRAIYENELASDGIMVNDIGQIVSDGGNINTAQNIMAGYNAAKVDADTFAKRRAVIEKNMKDPVQKAAKLKALAEAEAIMLGTAKDRADMVFDDKSKQKDPDYKNIDQLITEGLLEGDDDDENSEIPSFITDDAIVSNNIIGGTNLNDYDGIMSTYTPSPGDLGYIAPTAPIKTLANKTLDKGFNYLDINPGSNQDNDGPITTAPKKTSQGLTTSQFQAFKGSSKTPSYGTDSGGLGDYQIQPTKPTKSLKTTKPGTGGGADSGGSSSGGGKIVCTMMNESYGFGSFRNKIWLKHSKGLAPEYQKGYHKLFLPLVKIAKTNKVVRKILEHIAVHRTIDIRQESRGKIHLLGRVYRKILEPLCYFVGKHG